MRFVTGHGAQGEPDVDWRALAEARQTLVFYMGIANSETISHQLMAHGLPGTTPVAVIERGTRPEQRVLTGRLETLADMILTGQVQTPALLIVGEVVGMYRGEGQRQDRGLPPTPAQRVLTEPLCSPAFF